VQANPDLTAYFDTGYWHAGVARELESLGYEPGEILLGGFDLVPDALQGMQNGYIQLQVDQQPYLQGFLPIIQAHLMDKYQLSAWDVNTGKALIEPADVEAILELSQEGYR
jgi:simple sugar transport system substrate-binding protein